MKSINKFLKFFGLTYVIRNKHDLSTNLEPLAGSKKYMLIFLYMTRFEKVLYETEYKIKE
jgi:hypothetical protein